MYKMRLILLFAIVIVFISSLPGGQAEGVAEATESDAEAEPAEPEWLQHMIDRFTRKLRLAEEERDELEKEV